MLLCWLVCGCSKPKSTDELLKDLQAAEEGDRIKAARTLPERKADAARIVPALSAALKDKESDVRRSAALGLGNLGELARDAIPSLVEAQKDSDARVRKAVEIALSRIDPQRFPAGSQ